MINNNFPLRAGIFTLALVLVFKLSSAQPWLNELPEAKKQNPSEINFYDIQDAFNIYWKDRVVEKGKGWKQFKRWENFMEPRVYPSGKINPQQLWSESEKKNNNRQLKSTTANWSALGPFDTPTDISYGSKAGSGRVNCVAFHPTDGNIIFAGAPAGGFWKSTNAGASWTTTTDDLLSMGVSDIAVNPVNPDIIYIATGDGDAGDTYTIGILKSTDGGLSWNPTGSLYSTSEGITFRRLIIHPTNPDILMAASSGGIFKTVDGGDNWTQINTTHFKDLEFRPGNPNIIYAAQYGGSVAGVYRSTDGGNTFIQLTTGISSSDVNRIELGVSPANPSYVYALCSSQSDNGFYGVYRSTSSGDIWSQMINNSSINLLGWNSSGNDSGGQGWYDLSLAVSPTNGNELYVGGVNIWKSIDGGVTWNINAHWYGDGVDYVHADQHMLAFNNLNNTLYSCNDGGLYKTTNGGSTWTDISDGLEILQIYRLGLSSNVNFTGVTGAQDNGTYKYTGTTWYSIMGGDGMECLIDYSNSNIMYAEVYYGSIERSTDGGVNFSNIQPSGSGDGAWVTPYIIHPKIPQTLYAGFSDVFKTDDRGDNWYKISNSLTDGSNITSLAVSAINDNYIYASTNGSIYRTKNGGSSWSNVSAGLPPQAITYIAISQYDPETIWLTFSGYSSAKVYQSIDAGDTWTNFSDGLPSIPTNCIVYENNSNGALYAGTDLGVYYRNNSMNQWVDFSDALPNVIVNELEINYAAGKIVAATYGRGMWVSDLYSEPALPAADFTYYVASACEGLVQLFDQSSGSPDSWSWDFLNGDFSALQNPEYAFPGMGIYPVQLVVSNSFGSDTINMDINVTGVGVVSSFSSDGSSFCAAPATVNFNNLSENGATYFWDFGDGTTSTEVSPSHVFATEGEFDISLITSSPFCGEDSVTMPAYVSIASDNPTIVVMNATGGNANILCCEGLLKDSGGDNPYQDQIQTDITIAPPGAYQLILLFDMFDVEEGSNSSCGYDYVRIYDGPTSSSTILGKYCNSNLPPASLTCNSGAATIRLHSDQYVTGDGFEITWYCMLVGEGEVSTGDDLLLYPNPNDGKFYLELNRSSGKDAIVHIFDLAGKMVYDGTFSATGNQRHEFDIKSLPSGLYEIEIIFNSETINRKLMIQK